MTLEPGRIRLDDALLRELGFGALAPAARRLLLERVLDELAERVGDELIDRVTDEQLDRYERVTTDPDEARAWLADVDPDHRSDPRTAHLAPATDDGDDVICEYAGTRWTLHTHRELARIIDEQIVVLLAELVAQRDRVVRDLR